MNLHDSVKQYSIRKASQVNKCDVISLQYIISLCVNCFLHSRYCIAMRG